MSKMTIDEWPILYRWNEADGGKLGRKINAEGEDSGGTHQGR